MNKETKDRLLENAKLVSLGWNGLRFMKLDTDVRKAMDEGHSFTGDAKGREKMKRMIEERNRVFFDMLDDYFMILVMDEVEKAGEGEKPEAATTCKL